MRSLFAAVACAVLCVSAAQAEKRVFIIANNGLNPLGWKCGALPSSATDGTPLDPASVSGGQGGAVVLTGADAIGDAIYAWSAGGTTVNVKQGTPKP